MSLGRHRSKIKKRSSISRSQVESGMIISCEYTNRRHETKPYLVICINSNYQGQFHCFKMNEITVTDIVLLASRYGTKEKQGIEYINASNPKSFYNTIKGISGKRNFKRFNPSKMKGVQVCAYDYEIKI